MKPAQYVPRRLRALWFVALLGAVANFPVTPAWADETIKVGGSGAAYPLISALASAYREVTPNLEIQLPPPRWAAAPASVRWQPAASMWRLAAGYCSPPTPAV